MILRRCLGVAALLLTTLSSAMAQDPRLIAGGCQGCHGADGSGAGSIPAIRGTMTRDEFIAVLREFRAGQREATVMGRIARGYTDADFAALAAHFAKQETRQ